MDTIAFKVWRTYYRCGDAGTIYPQLNAPLSLPFLTLKKHRYQNFSLILPWKLYPKEPGKSVQTWTTYSYKFTKNKGECRVLWIETCRFCFINRESILSKLDNKFTINYTNMTTFTYFCRIPKQRLTDVYIRCGKQWTGWNSPP